jgi:hypothetical protein
MIETVTAAVAVAEKVVKAARELKKNEVGKLPDEIDELDLLDAALEIAEVTTGGEVSSVEVSTEGAEALPDEIGEGKGKLTVDDVKDLPDEIGDTIDIPKGVRADRESKAGVNDFQAGTESNNVKSDDKKSDIQAEKNECQDSKESNVEKKDPLAEKIEKTLGTPEGIKNLIERHPEKAESWKSQLEALDTLNDPDATDTEKRSAQAKLQNLKGQLLETAVKDALSDAGFDVESQQRVVEGEKGGTRPDVIAKNNTDHPIEVFGTTLQPGETLSVECKCGGEHYLNHELGDHIPNQLSGQVGTKILLTTSDIKGKPYELANSVCDSYGAKLVAVDVKAADVENAIKEV